MEFYERVLLSICPQFRRPWNTNFEAGSFVSCGTSSNVAQELLRTITEWYITGILHFVTVKRDCQLRLVFYILYVSRENSRREELFHYPRHPTIRFVEFSAREDHETTLHLSRQFFIGRTLFTSRNQVELVRLNTPRGEAVRKFRQPDYPLIRLDDSYRPSRTCEMDLSINRRGNIRRKNGREF